MIFRKPTISKNAPSWTIVVWLNLLLLLPMPAEVHFPWAVLTQPANAAFGQEAAAEPSCTVITDTDVRHQITSKSMANLKRHTIKTKDKAGVDVEYEGVSLADLLKSLNLALTKDDKGFKLAKVLLVEGTDGYCIPFSLLELDPATTDLVVLFADMRNGKPLDAKEAPFRLVVPSDKQQTRWVRMIRSMTIVDLKPMATPSNAPYPKSKVAP